MIVVLLYSLQILILDEATAAVDSETDTVIQQAVKEAFSGSTVLIIAHRLSTVLDTDRVLVLDQGKVSPICKLPISGLCYDNAVQKNALDNKC